MLNLVTGGAGFIGTHLVRLLCERGERVRVLDLRAPVEPLPGVEYLQATITDDQAVRAATRGCRRVFHLAAHAGLWARDKRQFISIPGSRYILGAHDVGLGELLELLQRISGVPMPRRRVPYRLAWLVAAVSEWLADHVTRRPPAAPLAGVRLGGIPVQFDNRGTRAALGWRPGALEESLQMAVDDYRARGLLGSTEPPATAQQPKRAR